MRLPERSLLIALLLRGAVIWFLVRSMVGATAAVGVAISSKAHTSLLALTAEASIATVFIVGGLGLLEAKRRNEDRFLANLGVSAFTIVLLSMIPGSIAELTVAIIGPR